MLANLKFLADLPLYDEEKPYTLYGFPDNVKPITNCEFVTYDNVEVTDVRGCEEKFQLKGCGFEFHHKPSSCSLDSAMFEDFGKNDEVVEYLRETIAMAVHTLDASRAFCFDWRV
jgi:hypothetical protein